MSADPLCPEHELRAAMTDDEFWDHVYGNVTSGREPEGPNLLDEEDIVAMSHLANPCPECGQHGACAYDLEGRAMVHVVTEDEP